MLLSQIVCWPYKFTCFVSNTQAEHCLYWHQMEERKNIFFASRITRVKVWLYKRIWNRLQRSDFIPSTAYKLRDINISQKCLILLLVVFLRESAVCVQISVSISLLKFWFFTLMTASFLSKQSSALGLLQFYFWKKYSVFVFKIFLANERD